MQFAEITEDPFTNKTNKFFLVLDISHYSVPSPSATGVSYFSSSGTLYDPSGNAITYYWRAWAYALEITGTLSNEAYSFVWQTHRQWLLIPPKFQFVGFANMIGFWLTPDEVKQFILNGLSLKGGD